MKRLLILFLLLTLSLGNAFSLDVKKIEKLVFTLTNEERQKRKLTPLVYNEDLHRIARIHSKNMIKNDFFSHTDHQGRGPGDRLAHYIPGLFGGIGENIAYNFGSTEEEVARTLMKTWMNSSGHRANILNKNYSHLGIGISAKGNYYYATQNFGTLQAKLTGGLDEPVVFETTRVLTFTYLGTPSPDRLTIFVQFPNKRARYYLPDGRYYTGMGLFSPEWIDEKNFTITISFEYGIGDYHIVMGFNGSYNPQGLIIPVKSN